jgi:predicted ATPase/DNA-binding SARP family transcriptional activator
VAAPARLDIRLLGPVSVAVDGREVSIGSPKQRTLLAMLVLSHRASVEALAEVLWREGAPASVAATIHTLVSRVRRILEGPERGITIRSEGGGYLIEMDPGLVDVNRFHDYAATGRSAAAEGAWSEAADRLRRALSLWRGPALADLVDHDFARIAAVRLDEARVGVVEDLAEAELALGRPAKALAVLEPFVAEHPFRERLREEQMLALYRLGRQAEALAAYQDLRKTLADELGLDPTPALQTLEREILLQSSSLDAPAASPEVTGPVPPVRTLPAEPVLTGTLTFLFTDIESSTSRWEGDRRAMGADLARHDAILREAVEARGGQVFTHTGDGIGAAFPTAPAALAAALDGQQGLTKASWEGSAPLKVRMAIHAGTAEARAGTYFGPTLNRTARLLDEAKGGQILCSQAAADLTRDDLPPNVALVELGQRSLEGLIRPETLWQVLHPDLVQLPPDPILGPSPLPRPLTSLVGREAELSELCTALAQNRLVTITGLGGVGKTRLALEVISRLEHDFRDGACFVELAHLSDPALIAREILTAMGAVVGPASVDDAAERLRDVLADRHLLLVLDNCEQVLDGVRSMVDGLLRHTAQVVVLATSREVLSVPGEVIWRAPGLSLPPADATSPADVEGSDAVGLFVARAQAVQPGFGLTPGNAAAVARICRRLDGIPLALELAAARARILSVSQLAEHLDRRFRVLVGGPRSGASRHQTLQAAMDWSFDLLPEAERQLLCHISVFPQSFELDAAAAVVDDGADPLDVLERIAGLIDRSLLIADGTADTARYRLLDTVRDYAADRLRDAGEEALTRARHRHYYVKRVHDALRSDLSILGDPWVTIVALDRENFHTALEDAVAAGDREAATVLAGGLHYTWIWQGSFPAIISTIDADWLACSNASLHAEALIGLTTGFLAGRLGIEAIGELLERAVSVADSAGTDRDRGWTRYHLGYFAHIVGDNVTARTWLEQSLPLLPENSTERSWGHYQLGWVALGDGDADDAVSQFERALATPRPRSDEVQNVHTWGSLALAKAAAGDWVEASRLAETAVEAARQLANPGLVTTTLVRAAQVEVLAGSIAQAEITEALRRIKTHNLGWAPDILALAALAHEAQGRAGIAAYLLGGAERLAAEMGGLNRGIWWAVPALAEQVDGARHRLAVRLGAEEMAIRQAAGQKSDVHQLIEAALVGLAVDA